MFSYNQGRTRRHTWTRTTTTANTLNELHSDGILENRFVTRTRRTQRKDESWPREGHLGSTSGVKARFTTGVWWPLKNRWKTTQRRNTLRWAKVTTTRLNRNWEARINTLDLYSRVIAVVDNTTTLKWRRSSIEMHKLLFKRSLWRLYRQRSSIEINPHVYCT